MPGDSLGQMPRGHGGTQEIFYLVQIQYALPYIGQMHPLPPAFVGQPQHRHSGDVGMLQGQSLQKLRIDILPATDDHPIPAAAHTQKPSINPPQIGGQKKSVLPEGKAKGAVLGQKPLHQTVPPTAKLESTTDTRLPGKILMPFCPAKKSRGGIAASWEPVSVIP